MPSPYNIEIQNNCTSCSRTAEQLFCDMTPAAMKTLDAIKFTSVYPKGSILFVEEKSLAASSFSAADAQN